MAECNLCKREMLKAKGCIFKWLIERDTDKYYKKIRCGDPDDFMPPEEYGRCHDCGAKLGGYHHDGCDAERCPKCKGQLLSCGCDWKVVAVKKGI